MNTPLLLVIMDGFGLAPPAADNAISQARMPCWNRLLATCDHTALDASEEHVGLPHEQMGNSEVGHMNIGAGRVVMQELPRISRACADESFASNPTFTKLLQTARANRAAVHVIGLLSVGGVHGHQDHMAFVARHLAAEGVRGWLHFITDGRDTAPRSAINFYRDFQHGTDGVAPMVRVATLGGRYFAMDRDKNWQRTARAFNAIAHGIGDDATDVVAAIEQAYGRGQDDEFIEPVVFDGYGGMAAGDVVLVMNFRADRARQICTALVADDFSFFARDMGDNKFQPPACMAGLVEYSASLGEKMLTLFGKDQVVDTFGSVVAAAGLTQLRIAETEKYAHVTFFFNGGREEPYPREERIMVPSPKVATYDLAPAMSAEAVTLAVLESLHHKKHQVIILNYANPDMVGHCGKINAAVAALETLDGCLARLEQAMAAAGGTMVITADHGNIESMHDKKTNQPNTAHTLNPVPFLLVRGRKTAKDGGAKDKIEKDIGHLRPAHFVNGAAVQTAGKLADIAPTMLALLGIAPPASMTGRSLLVQK